MSKAVRRYGKDGARLDATHGSTGSRRISEADREPSPVPPSAPARTVGHIGPPRVEVVGHAPDGSGRWIDPTFDATLIGEATATHTRLEPAGMMHSASGGKFGRPSKVPTENRPADRRGVDSIADDLIERPAYTGGRVRSDELARRRALT